MTCGKVARLLALVSRGFRIHAHTKTHTPGTCVEIPTCPHTCTHTHTLRIRKKRPLLLTPRQTQTLQSKSEGPTALLFCFPCPPAWVPVQFHWRQRSVPIAWSRDTTRVSALWGVGGTAWWFDYFFFSLKKYLLFSAAQALSSAGSL